MDLSKSLQEDLDSWRTIERRIALWLPALNERIRSFHLRCPFGEAQGKMLLGTV